MADELENHQDLKDRGYHIIGDDAYKTSHTLATPWAGKNSEPAKTCYNYYHSAARVTIERAFALLSRRFLILKRPYAGSLEKTTGAPGVSLVVMVCMKLHNLSIEKKEKHMYVNPSDVSGVYETEPHRLRQRRADHRGASRPTTGATLLSSGDDDAGVDLTSGENHSVTGWYTSEHTDAGLTDWDPQYLAQRGQGTRTDTLCNPRQFHTKRMATQMMVRPNFREW